jgi:hypothetical protein
VAALTVSAVRLGVAGDALAMSPALVTKYLDAARGIARHAALLPEGIRFSPSVTRPDWTREALQRIRAVYGRYADAGAGTKVNLQGIEFATNEGGRLPVERYLEATLVDRAALRAGEPAIRESARKRGLSLKYLTLLFRALDSREPSLLLDDIRTRWRSATPADAPALAAEIARRQAALWKFNTVGHIGKVGGPTAWMEPVDPPAAAKKLGLDAPAGDHDHARRFAADAEAFRNLFPAAIAYAKIVISWSSPTTPAPLEIYPALAFDQMFRDDAGRGTRSVLDAVLADARDFRRTVSRPDQRRLDEYLESVRDVERRIDRAGRRGELQGWRPALDRPNIPRPADGLPHDIAEHMRIMCDLVVLAFQTDTTRVCTLKLNNDHSSLRFPHLNVDDMIHHLLSHSDTADWLKVNRFFTEQVAYIARKLDSIREGERTALDNAMLLYLSSMLNGGHDATQLPVVLVGGAGGRIHGGRVLDYRKKPNRQICRLYLSMMDKMGVRPGRFGDADAPLDEV